MYAVEASTTQRANAQIKFLAHEGIRLMCPILDISLAGWRSLLALQFGCFTVY